MIYRIITELRTIRREYHPERMEVVWREYRQMKEEDLVLAISLIFAAPQAVAPEP